MPPEHDDEGHAGGEDEQDGGVAGELSSVAGCRKTGCNDADDDDEQDQRA